MFKWSKYSYLAQTLRAIPVMTHFYSIVALCISPNTETIILFFMLFYDKLLNVGLKTFAEYFYDYYFVNNDDPVFIGRGKRPLNSNQTGCFINGDTNDDTNDDVNDSNLDKEIKKQNKKSYGMPSGHSQRAWLFATFICLKIIATETFNINIFNDNHKARLINNLIKFILCFGVFLTAAMVSYSRVIEECHTKQQVIIGGLVGTGLGYLTYIMI